MTGLPPQELADLLHQRLDASYRLAAVILRDTEEAEEATAAAFAGAWRRSSSLPASTDPDAWLHGILISACRDRWRRLHWIEPDLPKGDAAPRHDRFPHAAERDALLMAITRLPPEQRTLLALRSIYGLTDAQIAERVGQSQPMVRITLDSVTSQLWLAYQAESAGGEGRADDRFDADLPAIVRGMGPASVPPELPARIARIIGEPQPGRLAGTLSGTPALAASIGGALVVAVVLTALIGRTASGPAGNGPIGSAVPSGGTLENASAVPLPGALVPEPGWGIEVMRESSQGMQVLGWSPDESKMAVKGFTPTGASIIQVYYDSGVLARTIPGPPAGWISLAGWADDEHLITATYTLPGAAAPIWLRSAEGQTDTLIGNASGDIVFGLGSFAAVTGSSSSSFVIWRGGSFSKPIAGWPLAWSGDGKTLAFIGDLGRVGPWSRRGILRLVDRDSLKVRDLGVAVDTTFVSIDRQGRRLLVCQPSSQAASECSPALVDVSGGSIQTTDLPNSVTAVAWTADGTAVFYVGGRLYQWRVGSEPVAVDWQPDPGNGIVGLTRLGNGIGVYLPNGPAGPERVAGSDPPIVLIPGSSGPDGSGLAKLDGSELVYTRTRPNGQEELVRVDIASAGFGLPPPIRIVPPPAP